ncbi:hypothetical protein BGZ96_001266 [Linnemannia gamsii]|uniref:C2H2-type domain-containing protein n=1 Tax=Linnemannia gamsii TaxID=64522 RepID=A0ABQ7JMJ9_9FUNG|nr:hypothetical protein BGZ96_001266 [Linnemannia gamsii]
MYASGHYHILIKDRIPITLVIALPLQDRRLLSPLLGLLRRRAILSHSFSHSITVMPPALTRLSQHHHHHPQTQPTEESDPSGPTTPITPTLTTLLRRPHLSLNTYIPGHTLIHTRILPLHLILIRHGHPYDPTSSGPALGVEQRFPHPESYNPHRHSSHKSESYLQPSGPSGRRPSHSNRSQGSAGGAQQQPSSQSMAMDEDEDDDEDDGEIKQDTRGRRRSNSFTSGQTQEGGANKKQAQDGDHSDVHKCLDCGKVYKHPNCLWKHRWLHSQYWKSATKFLLSKHQQVQLMEAAAILLGMDESRQGDNDPIVSMFSKQRGALANSVGSGSSSSSASPPTYTKSLSGSPPPQSERQHQRGNTTTSASFSKTTEVQHADIQMLTALRGGHASLKAITTSFPTPPPITASAPNSTTTMTSATPPTIASTKNTTGTASAPSSQSSSLSSSPSHSKSGVNTTSSSSRSTPPTLTADDESIPEMDEEMTNVTPPSRGESTPIIPVVRVIERLGGSNSVGVVGMGIGMDVDPPKHQQQGSLTKSVIKQGPPHSQQQQQQHDYRGGEDRFRYSGYQQQQHQQPLPFHHQPHLQSPARPYGHHQSEQQHSRHHQQQTQQQQHRA